MPAIKTDTRGKYGIFEIVLFDFMLRKRKITPRTETINLKDALNQAQLRGTLSNKAR